MIRKRPGALSHAQRALAAKKQAKLQYPLEEMEAIEPTVRAILDDIVIQDDRADPHISRTRHGELLLTSSRTL